MKQIIIVALQLKFLGFIKIHHVFHVYLLEPYHTSTIPRRIYDPPPPIEIDGEQKYEMDYILRSRIFNC